MNLLNKTIFLFLSFLLVSFMHEPTNQNFQGKAYYFSKSKLELGNWGARMSEAQKKQMQSRLSNRLEKTFILSFNKEESIFEEEEKVDAISGATDSWGSNFSRGKQYKNIKENQLVQTQEFYGKRFLVKDKLQNIDWKMESDSKKIGQYMCFKATASVPTKELSWFIFSWGDLSSENDSIDIQMTEVEAWYTLQIPLKHGPAEYGGLPGLILAVSAGNTTILCSQILINPKNSFEIEAPSKGKIITKMAYQATLKEKMLEMRNNRGRRRRN